MTYPTSRLLACATLAILLFAAPAVQAQPVSVETPARGQWDGLWLGGSVGWKWLDANFRADPLDWAVPPAAVNAPLTGTLLSTGIPVSKSGDLSLSGLTAGGLFGINRQHRSLVFGIEGAADFADVEGSDTRTQISRADYSGTDDDQVDFADRNETCRHAKDMSYEASLRGRVGYLVGPSFLLFATGGLSAAYVEHEVDCLSTTNFVSGGAPQNVTVLAVHTTTARDKDKDWEFGWTAGGGAEKRFRDGRWHARFDYAYVDLGSTSQTVNITRSTTNVAVPNTGPSTAVYKWDENYHKIRFSLIRKFGRP